MQNAGELARAAIKAMREPTEGMRVAGMDAVTVEIRARPDDCTWWISPHEAGRGFTAMIDTALSTAP